MKVFWAVFPALALMACGGGETTDGETPTFQATSTSSATVCGLVVGPNVLEGIVTSVHDGDTLTLDTSGNQYQIRLDGIDAPELAQAFGDDSRVALASSATNQSVKVAYAKQDQYGRIVGAVFNQACEYINLKQVETGMAWFYKAYQCELSEQVRSTLTAAQQSAVDDKIGLWAQDNPEAPWFFRNGKESITPTCSSSSPVWPQSSALTQTGSTTAGGSSTTAPDPTKICYTGPRGGTYTITANGNKNYSGC